MAYEKDSIANILDRDREYKTHMIKGSKNLLAALWRDHDRLMKGAKECGRNVVMP